MKNANLFPIILLCIAGCDATSRVESPSSPVASSSDQDISANVKGSSEQLVFNLSEAATAKVRIAMASVPEATHLVVYVDVDDEKYCTGFHYNLEVKANPTQSRFVMTESNGIKLAIEKDDVKFLNETTLDFATLASGTEGFVFRNPNENVSIPQELRNN